MAFGCCNNVNMTDERFIKCTKCRKSYHYGCLSIENISDDLDVASNWVCPECLAIGPKCNKDCTPIRNVTMSRGNKRPALASPSPPAASGPAAAMTTDDLRTIMQELLKEELSLAIRQINTQTLKIISNQLEPIKQEIRDIQQSMTFMSARFDDIELEQTAAKKTVNELLSENEILKSNISDLSLRINQIEQQARSNNVEIQCVPEKKSENLYSLVHNLIQTVKCDVSETSILNCIRIAKMNNVTARPRSIVVQLASPKARDHLLAGVINYNKKHPGDKLNSSHLGFTDMKSPIFVVEHLSPANKQLHAAARRAAKEKGYKHVWVRNGRIFVRRADDTDVIYIKGADSLKKIM